MLMGVMHRTGDRRQELGGGARVVLEVRQMILEAAMLEQLHAEERLAVLFTDLVDRHDMGMIETRRSLGLVLKPAQLGRRREAARLDFLERHPALGLYLVPLVDR